jgi:hypothetical protein
LYRDPINPIVNPIPVYGHQRVTILIVSLFLLQVALSFHKIVAEALGLKLSRAEQEEQQPLMQAEILHSPATAASSDAHCPAPSHLPTGASKSAICEIQ